MNEEENNKNEENKESNDAQQRMQDTANMVKDGAKLAKDAASGNVLGAIKSGFNLLKNKQFWIRLAISTVMPIITILLAAASILGIFNAVGDAVQSVITAIVDFFTIDENGAIEISDEQIDAIINGIDDLGVSIEDLKLTGDIVDEDDPEAEEKNKEALRKYIKKFYEAQAVTQTLDYNLGLQLSGTFGSVKVYRAQGGVVNASGGNQLKYIAYEKMQEKQKNNETNIVNYFSVNDLGQLVVAEVRKTNTSGENTSSINLVKIDYKSVISQYTTSMNFFLYLTMITQNPEFVDAVTELVKDSEIHITLMENVITETIQTKRTYTKNTKYADGTETTREPVQEQSTTTSQRTEIFPAITYVKTWFCEQTIEYSTKNETANTQTTETEPRHEEEPQIIGDQATAVWITNDITKSNITANTIKYEESVRGDVIDRTGEKGDGEDSFIGLLDVEFKIPNSTRKVTAGGNLISGAEMFFYLLQKDAESQNLEQIMRYVLYKYTGRDYGVTELDLSIFDAKELKAISSLSATSSGTLLKEYIRSWEHSTPPPTSADGTKYIIEDDGAGIPTVGYGVNIEARKSRFEEAGYPTTIGGEVDIEFVDALEDEIRENYREQIIAYTAGLDLTDYQINALVSRAYNCGVSGAVTTLRGSPSLNFVDSYKKYWNQEKDDLFEEKDPNADYTHSLYTQYMSKPTTSDGVKLEGLERRRKSEWRLFQSGYYDTLDKWHQGGGDILEMCVQVMNDMISNNVHYSLTDLVWNNIEASSDFSKYSCCCATYVSVVLYKSGALEPDFINKYNYNYTGTVNAGGVSTMLRDAGWIKVSEEEAEPGDVCVYDGHTFIYAGGNDIWDQNSGCYQPTGGTLSQWNYYKSTYDLDIWRMP